MVVQSCLVCPETPALASQHLDQLLQQEEISKMELVKLGVCSDLDLDTLLLLSSNQLDELFLPSSMTNLEKFCFRSALPCLTPRLHLKQGITEADLRKYITKRIHATKRTASFHYKPKSPPNYSNCSINFTLSILFRWLSCLASKEMLILKKYPPLTTNSRQ
ncbi:MAG: hypothetical protein NXY57DRAFT_672583 [Lentinula lateritia]|nr:MAG: hypothetical protein NXY57DRAFT_672583 [Lentinula lateritia]